MAQNTPIEFKEREILILYKPKIKKDNNTYALAKQLSDHIREVDVFKDKLTPTQLKEVIDMLGVGIEDIIERDSDTYKEQYKDKAFDEADWIEILVQNPDLLRTPIVFKGKKGVLIETPSNVLKLDPEKGIKRGER